MAEVNTDGMLISAGIQHARRTMIEKGPMKKVHGIIIHQTDSPTAQATLNAYLHGRSGAHFLIDKNGTIYQTASLNQRTWHVGKLRAKCFETHGCDAAELRIGQSAYEEIHKIEMKKTVPNRFPSNEDSIGIELVGQCLLDSKWIKNGMSQGAIEQLRAEKGVYESVTLEQNVALSRLVSELETVLKIPENGVYTHPQVSYKNSTEASTAKWVGK